MTRLLRPTVGLAALLLLAALRAKATGYHGTIVTGAGSGVSIELSSPVNSPPSDGFMPLWVTVGNRSGAARTWKITGEETSYYHGSGQPSSVQTLRVENDQQVRFPLLIPLELTPVGSSRYAQMNVRVEGYGVEEPSASIGSGSTGSGASAYVAMGDALATPIWGSLTQAFKDHSGELAGSPVEVGLLPSDWRGLSGFDCLWLTESEYTGLAADRRAAIRDWVNQGGRLVLCTAGLTPSLRASLDLPADLDHADPGYGHVQLFEWDGKTPPDVELVRATIQQLKFPDGGASYADASDWAMTRALGNVPVNALFLIAFISVFALVIGPANLFWLADARRRHRLFWTTPLIAAAASLLLMAVIVLQDGFGGHGERAMVTLLLPDQRKALVVQEQVSRTGVLLTGRFTAPEDLLLSQLKTSGTPAKGYAQAGRDYSGDWFTSHNVQAQRAEAIVPSRAEVQLLPASGPGQTAPPVLVSSIPTTLRELFYVDAAGHRWRGRNLHTGEKITLESNENAPSLADLDGSQTLREMQQETRRPNSFCAVADDGPFLGSLPSIHWRKQRAVFVGPVTRLR